MASQHTTAETYKQYHRLVTALIPSKEHEIRRSHLTLQELESIPADTPMYRSFGKSAYMKSSKGDVCGRLGRLAADNEALRKGMEEKREKLEATLKAAEVRQNELFELIKAQSTK